VDLKELAKHWDRFGSTDPLWAVLTNPGKKDKKWDPEEFFFTGRQEIAGILDHISSTGYILPRGKALDFGCGVGRITQALANHFNECVGVDISPSMIQLAEKYNRHGIKCRYFLNGDSNLGLFPEATFDFIYSGLVLQHMEPVYSKEYILEFFRVLAPGGMAVFQIPSGLILPAHPLSDSTFRARISVPEEALKIEVGKSLTLQATVQNISPHRWPVCSVEEDGGVFSLGNHWLDRSGSVVVLDDGRVTLPECLEPGEEAKVELTVLAPAKPGRFLLELDMVLEGICWFKDKGSAPVRLPVEVEDGGPGEQSSGNEPVSEEERQATFVPRMEMYGTPKERILSYVYASGCDVLDVTEDFSAGPGWMGYRYFITKPASGTTARSPASLGGRPAGLHWQGQVHSRRIELSQPDGARNLATYREKIRELEERTAILEEQNAKQRIELDWLYRWIPVNRLARRLLFARNLRKRLKTWLHSQP
jgi:SAM-dependent methyltransferase